MRWIHATIVGAIGADEAVAHTLNFRTAPAPDVDQSPAQLLTFAGQIRDAWVTFLTGNTGSGTVASRLPNTLVYKEVRAAYLEQTAPATISTHLSRKTGHQVKDFAYPKPDYIVPTQYAAFAGGTAVGAGTTPLPYEVALCLSLATGLRGPRNRGRFYLGPLDQTMMSTAGQFDATKVAATRDAFAAFIHTLNLNTGNRLHVVSRAYATSVGVSGVTAGAVPDSQRRRRRSRPEAYPAVVAT